MPSFAVIIAGMDITHALVLSQVVLSLILPIPMVALVRLTANLDVMGEFANSRLTNAVAVTATVFVSALNAVLLSCVRQVQQLVMVRVVRFIQVDRAASLCSIGNDHPFVPTCLPAERRAQRQSRMPPRTRRHRRSRREASLTERARC
jgi:hypothetical protein